MYNFFANPRDGFARGGACNTCCCETIHGKPGETNLITIDYTMWVVGMADRGLTVNTWFTVERITPFRATDTGDGAPSIGAMIYQTVGLTPLVADLNDYAVDPEGGALFFDLLPLYPPQFGTIALNRVTGVFTYTPNPGSVGSVDTIYFDVTDAAGNVTRASANIGVGVSPPTSPTIETKVTVPLQRKRINSQYNTMSFPLQIRPDAVPGEIFRINVRQEAINCDGDRFYHVSCFDIVIGKC